MADLAVRETRVIIDRKAMSLIPQQGTPGVLWRFRHSISRVDMAHLQHTRRPWSERRGSCHAALAALAAADDVWEVTDANHN
jgi:hypothetical protein